MKKIIYLLPVVALVFMFAIKSDADNNKENSGIQFYDGDWNGVLNKATTENKLIFIDIYATWCGPCKALKRRTFPDNDLGVYFNKHFVNVTLDGEKGKGLELAEKYQIRGYPTLLVLDNMGRVVVHTAGYRTPEQLLEIGKAAVTKYDKEFKQ